MIEVDIDEEAIEELIAEREKAFHEGRLGPFILGGRYSDRNSSRAKRSFRCNRLMEDHEDLKSFCEKILALPKKVTVHGNLYNY